MTAPLLATRDALQCAACECGHPVAEWHHPTRGCTYLGVGTRSCPCERDWVDALLASSVVRDPATLTDTAEQCRRCNGPNVTWFAPSPLWNMVMRGNDINGEPRYGDLVCVGCFIVLAEEMGVASKWRLSADPEPEGLIKVTPSGRIWDETRDLWVDPDYREEWKP